MKKVLSVALAFALVLGVCFSVPMIASGADVNDLTFELNAEGTGYIVKSCNPDASGSLEIPATFNPTKNNAAVVPDEEDVTEYSITIDDTIENGSVAIDEALNFEAVEGTVIDVTVTPVTGYRLKADSLKITYTENEESKEVVLTENKFTMPAGNVEIDAEFELIPTEKHTITIDDKIVNGSVAIDEALNFEAVEGTVIDVTVTPVTGYRLKADSLKITYTENEESKEVVLTENKFTMPAFNVTITAEFELIPSHIIKIDDEIENGSVAVDAKDFTALEGATVNLTVTPADGYRLVADSLSVKMGETVVEVKDNKFTMPAGDVTITAKFETIPTLVIAIDDNIPNGSVATDKFVAYPGEVVTLAVTPAEKYILRALVVTDEDDNEITVTDGKFIMPDGDVYVTATFIKEELPVVAIADEAFKGCGRLTSISIPKSVETIGKNAFVGCKELTEINIAKENKAYISIDGVLYNNDLDTVIAFPSASALTDLVLPETVKNVAEGAFYGPGMMNLKCVFTAQESLEIAENNEYINIKGILHLGMTAHTKGSLQTIPANCIFDGKTFYKCTVCQIELEPTILPLDPDNHTIGDWEVKQATSCKEAGIEVKKCELCKEEVETRPIEKLEHTPGEWETTQEPTCTAPGVKTAECTVCGEEVTDTIPATEHPNAYRVKAKDATCTEEGHTGYLFCPDCKKVLDKGQATPVIDHTVEEWKTMTDATCTEEGTKLGTCKVCGKDDIPGTIDKIPHTEVDGDIITNASCTEPGERKVVCDDCGKELGTKEIPATNHANHELLGAVEVTCTENGYTGDKVCNDCFEVIVGETIPATGHTESDWITEKSATCLEAGSKYIKCNVCQEELERETIDALGHNFVNNECTRTDCDVKEFEFTVVEDILTITGYNGSEEILVIPSEFDEISVSIIGANAFDGGEFATVRIPETVTTIATGAFANCANLKAISIPETVETIGQYAFGYTVVVTPGAEGEESTTTATKVDDFKVYGTAGTAAEAYATANDFEFVKIADVYSVNTENATERNEYVVAETSDVAGNVITLSGNYTAKTEASYIYGEVKLLGTGSVVTVYDENNNIVDVRTIAVKGDINGDGVCDVIDCMLVNLAENSHVTLDGAYLVAGDYNVDNNISTEDFQQVVNNALGVPEDVEDDEEETSTEESTEAKPEETTKENTEAESDTTTTKESAEE